MDSNLRVEVLATLKQLRDELQDYVEDSVICQLDQIIQILEAPDQGNPGKFTPHDLLDLLSKVLEALPVILGLIELLRRLYR